MTPGYRDEETTPFLRDARLEEEIGADIEAHVSPNHPITAA